MGLMEIISALHRIRTSGKAEEVEEFFALGFAEGVLYAEAMKEQQVTTVYVGDTFSGMPSQGK